MTNKYKDNLAKLANQCVNFNRAGEPDYFIGTFNVTAFAELIAGIEAAPPADVEPVAWCRSDTVLNWKGQVINGAMMFPSPKGLLNPIPLYTHPPADKDAELKTVPLRNEHGSLQYDKHGNVIYKSTAYGYCPICGAVGKSRERRPNGNDRCEKGCVYPSAKAIDKAMGEVNHE